MLGTTLENDRRKVKANHARSRFVHVFCNLNDVTTKAKHPMRRLEKALFHGGRG